MRAGGMRVLVVLALVLLGACGKKSSPQPPGPANEITYPRIYPSR